ncbi:MAG TPA: SGNH/GDSL hydrolase family protein [Nocardioides sp.]|nr:SGNH/GDSL hydrolase family protein [Nocardioides sp.]
MTGSYLRFAALGDSTTVGVGDRVHGGAWRGWARLLAESLAASYDVSFCNLAMSGATTSVVRERQLPDAVAHRADLASLVVGMNDTLRSTWDPVRVREDLFATGGRLAEDGATLLTIRFHDHGAVLGLPGFLQRPLKARIDRINEVYDELHATYGGLRLDLAGRPELTCRDSWSVDRFHPSELGHRALAIAMAQVLREGGFDVVPPGAEPCGGMPRTWRRDAAWMVVEGAPWVGRRARDLGPWAVRRAVARGEPVDRDRLRGRRVRT